MKRILPFVFLIWLIPNSAFSQQENEDFLMFSIYFRGGSYIVTEDQENELYDFVNGIEGIENYSISIHGHTDDIGPVEWNEWLSEMRSESAVQILLQHNIFREMITKKDFGLHNPIYDNSTWLGKMKNRRVDIIFWPVVM